MVTVTSHQCPSPPNGCGLTWGLDKFPRLAEGEHRCAHCLENDYQQAIERSQKIDKWVQQSSELFGPEEIVPTTILSLMSEVLREAGGVAGLARVWMQQLQAACEAEPGSTRALKGCEGIARFILKSSELSQHREDIARMEPAEIAMELSRYMGSQKIQQMLLEHAKDGDHQPEA